MEKELNRLSELALALAKSRGFESVWLYSDWREHIVFEAKKQYKSDLSDFPEHLPLILVNNNQARWANANEATEITILYQ